VKKTSSSEGFKEQALSKVFSRGDRTVQAVADELNISVHTLKNCKRSFNRVWNGFRKEMRMVST
jgi:hypothetical protein